MLGTWCDKIRGGGGRQAAGGRQVRRRAARLHHQRFAATQRPTGQGPRTNLLPRRRQTPPALTYVTRLHFLRALTVSDDAFLIQFIWW